MIVSTAPFDCKTPYGVLRCRYVHVVRLKIQHWLPIVHHEMPYVPIVTALIAQLSLYCRLTFAFHSPLVTHQLGGIRPHRIFGDYYCSTLWLALVGCQAHMGTWLDGIRAKAHDEGPHCNSVDYVARQVDTAHQRSYITPMHFLFYNDILWCDEPVHHFLRDRVGPLKRLLIGRTETWGLNRPLLLSNYLNAISVES